VGFNTNGWEEIALRFIKWHATGRSTFSMCRAQHYFLIWGWWN